jgi:ribosome biogenesis ATPase
VVIGATNRPDALDPALRRAGRFDREVCLGIPDKDARVQILQILCNKLKLAPDFSYEYVALNTPGFVGADLMALTREASMVAVNRFVYHSCVTVIVLLEYCYYRINFDYFFYFPN